MTGLPGLARAAFATGYAEHGVFPPPATARAACAAAVHAATVHELADPAPIVEAGRVEGRRAALARRRQRLYDRHRSEILATAALLTAAVHRASLTDTLTAAAAAGELVRQVALDHLTSTMWQTDGLHATWQQANADAYRAATAEGTAEAAAGYTTGTTPTVPAVQARFNPDGVDSTAAWTTADTWTATQLGGLAGDLARTVGDGTAGQAALLDQVGAALDEAAGVTYWLEEQMHGAYSLGFTVYAGSAGGTVNFVTMGDSRVESLCASYEGANPWAADDVPQPPIHGRCRCHLEAADLAPALAGV